MADIFTFKSPEELKRRRNRILLIVGIVIVVLAVVALVLFLVLRRPAEQPTPPPDGGETLQPISEVIEDLNTNTNRDFTAAEAEALATRINDEWVSRATDAEKSQLYSLQAKVYNRAALYAEAAASLELALPLVPADAGTEKLYTLQQLTTAYQKLGDRTKQKQYAVATVEAYANAFDDGGKGFWEAMVAELTAAGY